MGPCDNPRLRCAHTHTHTHTHNVDCHRLHLSPSLEKGKDVKLQGVTCTKLSSFLNVNVYKQLGQEKEKERGMWMIGEGKAGGQRKKERVKRVGILWGKKRRDWEGERGRSGESAEGVGKVENEKSVQGGEE